MDPGSSNGAVGGPIDMGDISGVLAPLSLTSVRYGRYLLIMRSELDVMIGGEPYLALMLWLDLDTGQFVTRIWNQSVSRGSALKVEQLTEACESLFTAGRPCVGVPQANDDLGDEFLVSQTPIPRQISRTCHRTLGREVPDSSEAHACAECLKLKGIDAAAAAAEVKCKKEAAAFANGNEAAASDDGGDSDFKYKQEEDDYDSEEKPDPEDLIVTYDYPVWEKRDVKRKARKKNPEKKIYPSQQVKRVRMKCPYCTLRQFPSTSALENHMKTQGGCSIDPGNFC